MATIELEKRVENSISLLLKLSSQNEKIVEITSDDFKKFIKLIYDIFHMQTKNPNEEENNRRIYNEIVSIFDFLNLNSITEYI